MPRQVAALLRSPKLFSPDKNRETLVALTAEYAEHSGGEPLYIINAGATDETAIPAFAVDSNGAFSEYELHGEEIEAIHMNGVAPGEIALGKDNSRQLFVRLHDRAVNYPFAFNGALGLSKAKDEVLDKEVDETLPARRLYVVGGKVVAVSTGAKETRKWFDAETEPLADVAQALLATIATKMGIPATNFALGMDFKGNSLSHVTAEVTRVATGGRAFIKAEAQLLAKLAGKTA